MAVTLLSDSAVTGDALWSTNAAVATDTGDRLWSILTAAAGTTWLVTMDTPARPGERLQVTIWVNSPTGPGFPVAMFVTARDASSALQIWSSPVMTTASGPAVPITITTDRLPAGTTLARVSFNLVGVSAVAGRTFNIAGAQIRRYATADELIAARLTRPMNTTAVDSPAGTVYASAPAGALEGTLQTLHPTLASALALDACYQAGPVALDGYPDPDLTGWRHVAVDRLQIASERPLPGFPARWLATAQVKGL